MMRTCSVAVFVLLTARCPAGDAVTFDVDTVEGKPLHGELTSLADKWRLRIAGHDAELPATAWVSLRRKSELLPKLSNDSCLILTSGDRIRASGITLQGSGLSFTSPWFSGGKSSRLSLDAVAMIWLAAPDNVGDIGAYQRQLLSASRRRDAVVLRNGDLLEGVLNRVDARNIELIVNRRPVRIALERVSAVALSTVLASTVRHKDLHGKLVLKDGNRLSLKSAKCTDGRTLMGTTFQSLAVSVPLEQVVALDLLNGQAVYLSDLKWAHYQHKPYLSVGWPLSVNASVTGSDLRLGGGTFERGLGMHSAAKVRFTLPEGAKRFEAVVGLDDGSGRKGRVRLRVEVDGKEHELPDGGLRGHSDGPLTLRVNVSGGKELMLIVDFGSGGDVEDHVNWANARIIR